MTERPRSVRRPSWHASPTLSFYGADLPVVSKRGVVPKPEQNKQPNGDGGNFFADVENKELQTFLRGLSNVVEREWRTWPIPTSILHIDLKYSRVTRILTDQLGSMIVDVLEKRILPNEDDYKVRRVGKDSLYAFGALMWAVGEIYSERNRRGRIVISDPREKFPWDKVISVAKAGLGKNRFAGLINNPVAV